MPAMKTQPPTQAEDGGNSNRSSPMSAADHDHTESPLVAASPSPSSVNSTVQSSSPPQSPSLPVALHLHPKTVTPQTLVLGRDGSDYRDMKIPASNSKTQKKKSRTNGDSSQAERQQALLQDDFQDEPQSSPREEPREQNKKKPSKSWWKKGLNLFSSSKDEENDDHNNDGTSGNEYASMDSSAVAALPQHQSYDEQEATIYYHDLSEEPSRDVLQQQQQPPPRQYSTASMHRSFLRNLPLPDTPEDKIQQDCSFLYRAVEESNGIQHPARRRSSPTRRSRGLRAVMDPPPQGVSTLYRDAQDVLAPLAVANFQTKYHQLNQEYDLDDHDRYEDYNDYAVPQDLDLEEGQQREPHTLVTDTATQSCLFYEHETTGRVELRLPRDHVRLMVDPSMEAGILSVVQCRRPDDPSLQQLEYCLTVPPDLYQRVISEMTHYSNHWSAGGGLESFASEHADIKVAIGALILVLVILGIQTLIWPVD